MRLTFEVILALFIIRYIKNEVEGMTETWMDPLSDDSLWVGCEGEEQTWGGESTPPLCIPGKVGKQPINTYNQPP